MPKPIDVVAAIRVSFIGAEQVYTQGSCVAFYFILKSVFPSARPYWSTEARHMITRIGNRFYDITGEVKRSPDYLLDSDTYTSMPVAVALPNVKERRIRFTTPKRFY